MIRLGFAIRSSIPTPRRLKEVARAVHQAMAEAWATKFLPRHFQSGASGRYGYSTRTKATRRKKRAKRRPYLVDEGELRQMTVATAPYGIKAAPDFIKLSVDTPPYVTQQQQGNQPDYAAEVFATIPSEEAELMRIGEAKAGPLFEAASETKTTNIG